jgi:hypothetical protein
MILPQIKKKSFVKSIQNLSKGVGIFKPLKLLWYPACGWDFRVLHHSSTNNISVQSDFFILSDLNNWNDKFDNIITQEGFIIQESEQMIFEDLPEDAECYYKTIHFDNGHINFTKRFLLIWNISNERLIDIFRKIEDFKLETIFLRRQNEPQLTDQISLIMQTFNTRYYINSFYSSGLIIDQRYQEAINFARDQNLYLRAINGYEGVGAYDVNVLDFVFTFERV